MTSFNSERRKVLAASGAALATALAGCSAFADGRGVPGSSDPVDDDDTGNGDGEDDWLAEVGNWDGEAVDLRGEEDVEVLNGEVDGIDQQYVFEPAEIHIDPGTTVTWVWSGDVTHTVTHRDEEFDSGNIEGDGEEFEYTFEEEGFYEYKCTPHEPLEQKGRVIVGDPAAAQDQVDDYLADVANYDGTIEDFTDDDSVTVLNGSIDGAGQPFAYGPAAIRIQAGTEVTWEWTGGTHSVTNEDGAFDSGNLTGEGQTFSHTFEEAGVYLYYCQPHRGAEQKGAVVVE